MKSFNWKVKAFLAATLLLAVSNCAKAEGLKDVLKDKIPVDQGRCYFKNENFFAFASGSWMSPNGVVDRVEQCFVFAENPVSNPNQAWFVLLDRIGFPKEVIQWDHSIGPDKIDKFESIWKPGPKPEAMPEPKIDVRPTYTPKGTPI